MKKMTFALTAILSLALSASAMARPFHRPVVRPVVHPHHPHHPVHPVHPHHPHHPHGPVIGVTCSSATIEKNTNAAETTLVSLAQNELKNESIFTSKVADFTQLSSEQKIDEGMRIAGVKNPNDASEVLNVLFAREPSAETVQRVSENLNLSSAQAKLVITRVSKAMTQR